VEVKPILLTAEEDILMRTVAVEIAQEAGFAVLQSADAGGAIRIIECAPNPPGANRY
jgi:hypothetical protein